MNIFLKKVECSGIIERKEIRPNEMHEENPINKKWIRQERIFIGHIIGERILSNGFIDYTIYAPIYHAKIHFKAYLVVYNIHRKPVYVLPEDVKIIE